MDTNIYNSDIELYNRDKLNLRLKFLDKNPIQCFLLYLRGNTI